MLSSRSALLIAALVFTPLPAVADISPGTQLTGNIDKGYSSKEAQVGDSFTLSNVHSTNHDINGAVVYGHIASVTRAGQGTPGKIALDFDKVNTRSGNIYKCRSRHKRQSGHEEQRGNGTCCRRWRSARWRFIGPRHRRSHRRRRGLAVRKEQPPKHQHPERIPAHRAGFASSQAITVTSGDPPAGRFLEAPTLRSSAQRVDAYDRARMVVDPALENGAARRANVAARVAGRPSRRRGSLLRAHRSRRHRVATSQAAVRRSN
jgi:hypothetical protein